MVLEHAGCLTSEANRTSCCLNTWQTSTEVFALATALLNLPSAGPFLQEAGNQKVLRHSAMQWVKNNSAVAMKHEEEIQTQIHELFWPRVV